MPWQSMFCAHRMEDSHDLPCAARISSCTSNLPVSHHMTCRNPLDDAYDSFGEYIHNITPLHKLIVTTLHMKQIPYHLRISSRREWREECERAICKTQFNWIHHQNCRISCARLGIFSRYHHFGAIYAAEYGRMGSCRAGRGIQSF